MFYTDLIDNENKTEQSEGTKANSHENEVKISSVDELSIADHIVIAFNDKNYCHCIVTNVNSKTNTIEIVYYDDGKVECDIERAIEFGIEEKEKKDETNKATEECARIPGVKKTDLLFDKDKFEIFKVIYTEEVKCLSVSQTIAKVNELVGESKYNVFENNDEHFANYCKTGKAGKLFVLDPQDVDPNEVFGGNIAKKLTSNLAQQGTNVILVNTATHIATRFPR